MLAAIGGGTAASLLLHLSLRSSPAYVGEGALWKFVSVSQYLPWVVVSVGGCVLLLYRIGLQLRKNVPWQAGPLKPPWVGAVRGGLPPRAADAQKSLLQDGWQQAFAFYSCLRLLGKR